MVVLGSVVIGLTLLVLLLLGRVRGLEERVARLEGRREETRDPYRVAPPGPLTDALVGSEGWDPEIREEIRRGNKIAAIKRYREMTGAGLKEAKEAVEAMAAGRRA